MDRPVALHVRADVQLACFTPALFSTMLAPKIISYEVDDMVKFAGLLQRSRNASSLPGIIPTMIIAEFADGNLVAYENVDRYFEKFKPTVMPCVDSKLGNATLMHCPVGAAPCELDEEAIKAIRARYEDTSKKIVENYISRIDLSIITINIGQLYNQVILTPDNMGLNDQLRREVHHYIRLFHYKCSLVPLREMVHMGKIYSILTTFDEAETDDTRGMLAQISAPSSMVLTLTRSQRKSRDREYVLHCLAFLSSLKFDTNSAHDSYT
jgi:hypothetical protein